MSINPICLTLRVDGQDFPVTDVARNIRYFLTMVKQATGNARDPTAEADKKEKSQRPGERNKHLHFYQ